MEKYRFDPHGGSMPPPLPPPPQQPSSWSLQSSRNLKSFASAKNIFMDPEQQTAQEISKMSDYPLRKNIGHHRRFHSESSLAADLSGPLFTDEDLQSLYHHMDKFEPTPSSLSSIIETRLLPPQSVKEEHVEANNESSLVKKIEPLHFSEGVSGSAEPKKAISAAKLAELALTDPKRAKRIWANRQSAAKSKEKKIRHIAELEQKFHTLQTETTSLSAQLSILQRDTNTMIAENNELTLRLQIMETRVRLQDALNEALQMEIARLKQEINQLLISAPQLYPQNHLMSALLASNQLQQLQIQTEPPQPPPKEQTDDKEIKGSRFSPSKKDGNNDMGSSSDVRVRS